MFSVTATDLAKKTKRVLKMVKDGVKIIIMLRNRPVAVLISPKDAGVEIEPWEEGNSDELERDQ